MDLATARQPPVTEQEEEEGSDSPAETTADEAEDAAAATEEKAEPSDETKPEEETPSTTTKPEDVRPSTTTTQAADGPIRGVPRSSLVGQKRPKKSKKERCGACKFARLTICGFSMRNISVEFRSVCSFVSEKNLTTVVKTVHGVKKGKGQCTFYVFHDTSE